jgi:hypothetical protein
VKCDEPETILINASELAIPHAVQVITNRADIFMNCYRIGRKKTVITDNIIETLVLYFTKSEKFEGRNKSYSLDKGLLLRGGYGAGKTMAMKLFADNPSFWKDGVTFKAGYNLAQVVSCVTISEQYIEYGYPGIKKYKNCDTIFTLDDMLQESEIVERYKEGAINPIRSILRDRYDLFQNGGTKTHATSNEMGADAFASIYGEDVLSRFSEMFNDILFEGDSKRG